jgi:hypothetical protein
MAMTPPRYGNFRFGDQLTIETLIERLMQIAGTFLDGSPFSSYLTTQDGQSFYGLSYEEVRELFTAHSGKLKSLSTSSSTQYGKGVSINLHFESNGVRARGQFVIATGSLSLNEQIEEMIYGVWTPRPEPKEAPPVSAAPQPLFKEPEKKRLPRASAAQNQTSDALDSIDISLDRPQVSFPADAAPVQVSSFREPFFFEREIPAKKLEKLLELISQKYLAGAPFSVNLTTMEGEPHVDIGMEGLNRFISLRRNQIQVVSLDASTIDGELVDIKLIFKEGIQGPNAEIDIFSSHTEEIKILIQERLAWKPAPDAPQLVATPTFKKRTFTFNEKQCLVAMPLEAYWSDPLWETMQLILEEAGMETLRAEALFNPNTMEKAWQSINESALLVADLTYKHPDVFFKIGIALTLGKQVLLLSQHDRDIPPDFQRLPHIVYDNNIEGLQKLRKEMLAALKDQ